MFSSHKDLPVLGRAQGGDNGNLTIEENPIDWTFRPADLQGVQGAFAVFVTGDSMAPKYKDQDLAYIHPTTSPRKGRFVLIETAEHKGLIKQFVKWEGETLCLRQFNPDRLLYFKRSEIRQIMLVIGSLDA
ncbi:S24 family peptidase [Kordiimonas pumila]|uniref:Helix-turn-helix transcriptional regulator n=1 Tax=Kordiimonas pumila TaxID=2161677 RepID=A0ABV7D3E2_9PROT|nr:helix-turn-helix transcriptional regulator [Kordiimonas pumila]